MTPAKLFVALVLPALATAFPAQSEPKPWRHGVIEPKSDAGFVLMAFKRDFAKKHGITSVKDLDGKTMATSAPSSMPDLVGRVAVEQAGLAAGAVKLANVGSDADRYRSLIGGIVDAAVISVGSGSALVTAAIRGRVSGFLWLMVNGWSNAFGSLGGIPPG